MEVVEQIREPVLEPILELLDGRLAEDALVVPCAVRAAQLEHPLLVLGLRPRDWLHKRRIAVWAEMERAGLAAGPVLVEPDDLDLPTAGKDDSMN